MFNFFSRERPIYADYASATPLDERVFMAMKPYLSDPSHFGNPSSIHFFGRSAKGALVESRKTVARLLQVQPDEIVFTSGGTESNNIAIHGVAHATSSERFHIITTSIEHAAILEPVRALEGKGAEVTYLPVDVRGRISIDDLKAAIKPHTVLVSIAYANGEIGSVEKIRDIGRVIRSYREKQPIYFHTDASQAANYLSLMPNDLGVDLMTLDASKFYGPKGVGCLFVKRGTPLRPLFRGGMQERGLRPGTENVPGIVGFAKALEIAQGMRKSESARLLRLRDFLKEKLLSSVAHSSLNGEGETLPNFLNICIPESDGEFLSVELDQGGVAVSSASACRSISQSGSSYVIEALPGRSGCGRSSLRISLGRKTSARDVEKIVDTIIRLSRRAS